MERRLISGSIGFGALIYFVLATLLGGLAYVGTTVGLRKWWGFLLIVPVLLLAFMAGLFLIGVSSSGAVPVVAVLAAATPIAIAAYVVWRWLPNDKHGA